MSKHIDDPACETCGGSGEVLNRPELSRVSRSESDMSECPDCRPPMSERHRSLVLEMIAQMNREYAAKQARQKLEDDLARAMVMVQRVEPKRAVNLVEPAALRLPSGVGK